MTSLTEWMDDADALIFGNNEDEAVSEMAKFAATNKELEETESLNHVIWHWGSKASLQKKLAKMPKPIRKTYADDTVRFKSVIGRHSIAICTMRSTVCERVEVGTKKVMKPDPAVLIEVDEPIYEWKCAPVLGESE